MEHRYLDVHVPFISLINSQYSRGTGKFPSLKYRGLESSAVLQSIFESWIGVPGGSRSHRFLSYKLTGDKSQYLRLDACILNINSCCIVRIELLR